MVSHPRRFIWLDLVERGTPAAAIARRHHLAIPVVQAAIDDARAQFHAYVEALRLMKLPLVLFFPINGLFPNSTCNHDRIAIPRGSFACCEVCARSGQDGHPALDRFPSVEPRPDPPTSPSPKLEHVTRRQKRAALSDHAGRARKIPEA
jgi:hypothetical protein